VRWAGPDCWRGRRLLARRRLEGALLSAHSGDIRHRLDQGRQFHGEPAHDALRGLAAAHGERRAHQFRQAWSILLGACVNYLILAPRFLDNGDITSPPTFRNISRWSLWIGVPMMVTSGLLLFAFKLAGGATDIRHTRHAVRRPAGGADDPMNKIEVPSSWFIGGFCGRGRGRRVHGPALHAHRVWMGIIAVLATFFSSSWRVASR